jgi:hypothetical protein
VPCNWPRARGGSTGRFLGPFSSRRSRPLETEHACQAGFPHRPGAGRPSRVLLRSPRGPMVWWGLRSRPRPPGIAPGEAPGRSGGAGGGCVGPVARNLTGEAAPQASWSIGREAQPSCAGNRDLGGRHCGFCRRADIVGAGLTCHAPRTTPAIAAVASSGQTKRFSWPRSVRSGTWNLIKTPLVAPGWAAAARPSDHGSAGPELRRTTCMRPCRGLAGRRPYSLSASAEPLGAGCARADRLPAALDSSSFSLTDSPSGPVIFT